METEIKLAFSSKESLYDVIGSDWFACYCIDPDSHSTYLLENSYIDTSDMKVSSRGGMIRSRHYSGENDDFYEFTVKYGGGVESGLHRRHEWNVKSVDGRFDIERFKLDCVCGDEPSELLDEVLSGITDDDLELLCSNSFTRTTVKLGIKNSVIEACFDYGTIEGSNGQIKEYICELELEIVEGTVDDLNSMADIVRSHAKCEPFDDTKYHRTIKYINKG